MVIEVNYDDESGAITLTLDDSAQIGTPPSDTDAADGSLPSP